MDLASLFSPIVKAGTAIAGSLAKPFEWGATLGKELGGSLKAPDTFNLNSIPKAVTIAPISPANSITRDSFWSGISKGVQGTFEKFAQFIVNPVTPIAEYSVKTGQGAASNVISSVYQTGAKAVSNNILGNIDTVVARVGNTVMSMATVYKTASDLLRGTVAQSSQDSTTGIKVQGGSATDGFSIPSSLLPIILTARDTGSTSGDLSSILANLFTNTNPVKTGSSLPEPVANQFNFGSPLIWIIIAVFIALLLFMRKA